MAGINTSSEQYLRIIALSPRILKPNDGISTQCQRLLL